MKEVEKRNFDKLIRQSLEDGARLVGICLGMQLLGTYSEESKGVKGLDIIAGTSNPILNFLNAQNRPGASSIISIGSSILTAILLFILVPELSYRGAALATLFGALTILIMRYTYFKHFSNSKYFY